jgi:hypothetical protein
MPDSAGKEAFVEGLRTDGTISSGMSFMLQVRRVAPEQVHLRRRLSRCTGGGTRP